jgi:AraC-like DNA-binding protein
MPDINGIDVCRKLKNDERTSHIPVIILTAKTGLEDRMEGLTSGADDYLNKPFDINELKIRIANLLVLRAKLRQKYGSMADMDEFDSSSGTIDERFMKKVNAIIRERIHNFDFDVGVLQEELGMSRVHLYRKLKALTGESPSSLIHGHRMKLAARMIREKKGNLAEIALSIGISNPSYFSRSFREHYGISPRDFADHPGRIKMAVTG